MADRHKTTPLSIRLPDAERSAVYEHAAREGIPVRQWIIAAVREKLDREASHSGTTGGA